jgi:hypothetical protein
VKAASVVHIVVAALVATACASTTAPDKPSGAWRAIESGQWNDVQWGVFAAGHASHGRCLAIDLTPPAVAEDVPIQDLYRGKRFNCSLAADEVATHRTFVPSIYNLRPGLRYEWLLATVPRKTTSIRLTLDDGSTAFTRVRAGVAVALFTGDHTPRKATLRIGTRDVHCNLNRQSDDRLDVRCD